MSHVSALPRAPSTSVLEESAAEATQFALATLESIPGVFDSMDAGDVAVGALGAAVVLRAAYTIVIATSSSFSSSVSLLSWTKVFSRLPLLSRLWKSKRL